MLRTCEEHDLQKRRQSRLQDRSARQVPHVDTCADSKGTDQQRKRDGRNHECQQLVAVPSQAKAFQWGPDTINTEADREGEQVEDALDLIG